MQWHSSEVNQPFGLKYKRASATDSRSLPCGIKVSIVQLTTKSIDEPRPHLSWPDLHSLTASRVGFGDYC
ncbi:hypothetical protein MUK42_36875 [Musa troglodytarum]|uniref:Uncharacterized protein n=1 Tax=Musa troglodytarum TaxID=320322 RepID=A0A9E7EC26_9LILI|nr:hypothetical protein MUK42_36875 [Musa troglodytarum]